MDGPYRLLLAGSELPLRAGVRLALGSEFVICAEVGDAGAAVAAARREKPDVCLVDLGLRGGALAAVSAIAALQPRAAIIVLARTADPGDIAETLRAGVAGVVALTGDPAALAPALRAAASGQTVLPRQLALELAEQLHARTNGKRIVVLPDGSGVPITEREWDVVSLFCDGPSTNEVAARMGVSATTVRRHLSKVMAKLGVTSRSDAVAVFEEALYRRSTA